MPKNLKLKAARAEKDMTQGALAEAAGVSRQTINAIEKGEYNPTINLCRSICKILGKTLDELFWEECVMRFSLYSKKNQLDEMQEQTLRKIEGRGFWLMWGGLLAAWIVQTMFGAADKAAGEWVVFMIGCIYMCVACLRNGLWDRHLLDTAPANALYSLVAVVAVTLISGFSYGYWVGAVIAGVFTGILCFALLQLCAALTRRQRKHLDNPKDEE